MPKSRKNTRPYNRDEKRMARGMKTNPKRGTKLSPGEKAQARREGYKKHDEFMSGQYKKHPGAAKAAKTGAGSPAARRKSKPKYTRVKKKK